MNLFEKIVDTRSLAVIHLMCEKHLVNLDADAITDKEKMTIKRIMETSSLDEVWLFCYEHLGNEEEAAKLRKWILDRPSREARRPKLDLGNLS